ncbi:MAG: HDIG domain-containing protein [Defluviitaleaceae bacterium]|nr:HDIG domain-containing protein [Defluviitaleaceae bacterium]
MRKNLINASLIIGAYLLTCTAIWMGPYFQSALSVRVGDVSPVRVAATRDVENVVATDRNREEAITAANAMPRESFYTVEQAINQQIFANISSFFAQLNIIRRDREDWIEAQFEAQQLALTQWQLAQIRWEQDQAQRAQLIADGEEPGEEPEPPDEVFHFEAEEFPVEERFDELLVPLSANNRNFLLSLDAQEHYDLHLAVNMVVNSALEEPGIITVNDVVLLNIREDLVELMDNVDAIDVGYVIAGHFVVPNRMFDENHFLGVWQLRAENYEVEMFLQHETLVEQWARISPEAYAAMEKLGLLETDWTRDIVPMIGIFILVAVTMITCCWFIFFYRKQMISRTKEALLLFTLYSCILIIMWTLGTVNYYFMPILVFTLLIAMLVDLRTAIILNLGFTLISYFVVDGTMHYMIFFVLSGSIMCLLARFTTERNKIMMVALISACFNFILAIAITLAFEPHQAAYSWYSVIGSGGVAALNGILTVIIAVGSLPLWEVIFGVVTPIKILDLTNPTSPLMRRLTIEAPGTYHHSLIVANLAESAAYDIGANPHIARAGGYYHDIGKLKYPHYFAENITGVNPHDEMDPLNSSQIIMSHISYGLTLATEYRLPQFIRDIIHEHHGNSIMKFFYCKAKDAANADESAPEIEENDYRYPYSIPQSKESAVVMLADGIEAAIRSMMTQGKNPSDIQDLINKMIKDKLTEGFLADSQLSIRDVDTISKSFYRVLKGMYHERIPYPQETDSDIVVDRR